VVLGALANRPFGGMTWQVLHHLEGFRRLGFDVWYVEDTDTPVLDPTQLGWTPRVDANIDYLVKWLDVVGMTENWVFRPPDRTHETLGALRDTNALAALYRDADAVFNLCGSHEMSERLLDSRCLVLLETDPGESQVALAMEDPYALAESARHDWLFTYGTNLGNPDCRLPVGDRTWHATVPPVVTDWWARATLADADAAFTSILRWQHNLGSVTWQGERWDWTKDTVFDRFIDLPGKVNVPMLLAVSAIEPGECERLRRAGWGTRHAATLDHPAAYRAFIRNSRAEFSVTKDRYVVPRTGWFSDRSVCYLAAGLPVVTQDTGLRGVPTGIGLVTFTDFDEAVDAVRSVSDDYTGHATTARELAREHFSAEGVLGEICRTIGLL
jgi:hypothetical protein